MAKKKAWKNVKKEEPRNLTIQELAKGQLVATYHLYVAGAKGTPKESIDVDIYVDNPSLVTPRFYGSPSNAPGAQVGSWESLPSYDEVVWSLRQLFSSDT